MGATAGAVSRAARQTSPNPGGPGAGQAVKFAIDRSQTRGFGDD